MLTTVKFDLTEKSRHAIRRLSWNIVGKDAAGTGN